MQIKFTKMLLNLSSNFYLHIQSFFAKKLTTCFYFPFHDFHILLYSLYHETTQLAVKLPFNYLKYFQPSQFQRLHSPLK